MNMMMMILVLDIVYEVESPCVNTLSAHLSVLILNIVSVTKMFITL